jgi:aminomethyltransferase
MSHELKRTLLYQWHQDNGARLAPFGAYEMPLWYASAKEEHLSVLTKAGLFDTSHMDMLLVHGPQSRAVLQWCCSRNLEACLARNTRPIAPGWSVYTVILNEQGHVIDDALVSQLEPNAYLVVVNAGMGAIIRDHFLGQGQRAQMEVLLLDTTLAKVDLQGPCSGRILSHVLAKPEKILHPPFAYFSFKGGLDLSSCVPGTEVVCTNNIPLILSRSGYTGEFGFEIFMATSHLVEVWEMLLDAGQEYGLRPCGLASRDSLRAGAVLPLSHQDIGDWPFLNNPWTFVLPWNQSGTGFTKEFLGKESLLGKGKTDYTYPFLGYDLRKVNADQGRVRNANGEDLGQVLTCVTDMGIDWQDQRVVSIASPDTPPGWHPQGLACGFVKVKRPLAIGEDICLVDSRRSLKVQPVKDIRPDRTARKPLKDMINSCK